MAAVLAPDSETAEGIPSPSAALSPELLLVRDSIENIGLLATLAAQDREIYYQESGARAAELHAYLYDGYWHGLRITPPASAEDQLDESTPIIIHLPGFGERVEDSVGAAFHDHLAEEFPQAWMISIAADGWGDTGKQFGNPLELLGHSLKNQARRNAGMIAQIAGERPVILTGTSMGTVKDKLLVNLEPDDGPQPNIIGGFMLDPALVPRWKELVTRMYVGFLAAMPKDAAREIKQIPGEELKDLKPKRGFGWREGVALVGEMAGMVTGSSMKSIKGMLHKLPASGVVGGEVDPVAFKPMWEKLALEHPELEINFLDGVGHAIAMNAKKSAHDIAEQIRHKKLVRQSKLAA